MSDLKGKTLFITGASRGIGAAIAERAAADGANVVIAAKTAEPHPKLEGTIYTAAAAVEAAGGQALPLVCDIRDEAQVADTVAKAVERFGGIDIVVNNASAIGITGTAQTSMKRYDLMNQINARGTFVTTQACLPYLKKAANPHILTLSPPVSAMEPRWFAPSLAYCLAKFGMSLCTLAWAEEFKRDGIAANSLWPRTTIATAALNVLGGDPVASKSRSPQIMADAAYQILCKPSREFSGQFCIDDQVLFDAGVRDFSGYAAVPGTPESVLLPDLFLPSDLAPLPQ